jgi:hypothetical protein
VSSIKFVRLSTGEGKPFHIPEDKYIGHSLILSPSQILLEWRGHTMLQAMPAAIPWSGPFHAAFCGPFHVAAQHVGTCEYKVMGVGKHLPKNARRDTPCRCTLPVLVRVQVFRLALVAAG